MLNADGEIDKIVENFSDNDDEMTVVLIIAISTMMMIQMF